VIPTRGGGDDQKFAHDTASSDGSWSTGNTGTAGKFYGKVRKTTRCKKDSSPTHSRDSLRARSVRLPWPGWMKFLPIQSQMPVPLRGFSA
jgi:hypothetical protein